MSETIYRIQHGSHLYGTNTPSSDLDYKEVYLPDVKSILTQKAKNAVASGPDKEEGAKNQAGDIDRQAFAVHKLFDMLVKGDIIGMEMIFTNPKQIEFCDRRYTEILANKEIFLSRKVDGYVGYCRQQANKYGIRGSRVASVRKAMDFFQRAVDIDPNMRISELSVDLVNLVAGEEHADIVSIPNGASGTEMLHIEVCNKKQPFTNTVKQAHDCYKRIFDEYGARAKQAETNEGIDWKALSHAMRVGQQAIELLNTGFITFPRPNAPELLSIKKGEVPYKKIAEDLDVLLNQVVAASEVSPLPELPSYDKVNDLLASIYQAHVCGDWCSV